MVFFTLILITRRQVLDLNINLNQTELLNTSLCVYSEFDCTTNTTRQFDRNTKLVIKSIVEPTELELVSAALSG